MYNSVDLWEKPEAKTVNMIAGWNQWADAGAISSGLPEYLIEQTGARKIGEIKPEGFYLFQFPGTHHLLRPVIKLKDGFRQSLSVHKNEIFYAGDDDNGLVILLGDEPHLDVDHYAEAFFAVVKSLNVRRVGALGGVYGEMPYDKERMVSCIYSLRSMKDELDKYAVRFSNYEGGATIGSYLVDRAEAQNVEFLALYAFVPAYEFSNSGVSPQGIRIENDYKAWFDLMRRFKHMYQLGLDLTDLEARSEALVETVDAKIEDLANSMPQLKIREYMEQVATGFTEPTFAPLDDVWEQEFRNLFNDAD